MPVHCSSVSCLARQPGFCRAIDIGLLGRAAGGDAYSPRYRASGSPDPCRSRSSSSTSPSYLSSGQANFARPVNGLHYRRKPGPNALPFKEAAFRIEPADPLDPSRLPFAAYHQREHQRGAAVVQGEDQVRPGQAEERAQQMQLCGPHGRRRPSSGASPPGDIPVRLCGW